MRKHGVRRRQRRKRSRIALRLDNGAFSLVDHTLLATGYRVDIAKFGILAPELHTIAQL